LFRCGAAIRQRSEVKRTRRGAVNSTPAPEIQIETPPRNPLIAPV
jgi:hypothetical protein